MIDIWITNKHLHPPEITSNIIKQIKEQLHHLNPIITATNYKQSNILSLITIEITTLSEAIKPIYHIPKNPNQLPGVIKLLHSIPNLPALQFLCKIDHLKMLYEFEKIYKKESYDD